MGIEMPSWYALLSRHIYLPVPKSKSRFDIYSFGFTGNEDESGMLEAARSINQLITTEVDEGLDPSRIVLGGFSQGGTMSLLTGLTGERKLGGLVVLSGWLPLRNKFKAVSKALGEWVGMALILLLADGWPPCYLHAHLLGPWHHRPSRQTGNVQGIGKVLYRRSGSPRTD